MYVWLLGLRYMNFDIARSTFGAIAFIEWADRRSEKASHTKHNAWFIPPWYISIALGNTINRCHVRCTTNGYGKILMMSIPHVILEVNLSPKTRRCRYRRRWLPRFLARDVQNLFCVVLYGSSEGTQTLCRLIGNTPQQSITKTAMLGTSTIVDHR